MYIGAIILGHIRRMVMRLLGSLDSHILNVIGLGHDVCADGYLPPTMPPPDDIR